MSRQYGYPNTQKTVWNQTLKDLASEGRYLSLLNYQTLVAFCDAAGLIKTCAEVLEKEGFLVDGGREGKKRNPVSSIRISALNALRSLAVELALTPSSSPRLPAKYVPPEENPFAEFL